MSLLAEARIKLKQHEKAVEDARKLVALACPSSFSSSSFCSFSSSSRCSSSCTSSVGRPLPHYLVGRALFFFAKQKEASHPYVRKTLKSCTRTRFLSLFQRAYNRLYAGLQLNPKDEELQKAAEEVRPYLDYMSALADEVSAKIFTLLSLSELHYASLVSRSWYHISSDNVIWRPLFEQHFPYQAKKWENRARTINWKKLFKECRIVRLVKPQISPIINCESYLFRLFHIVLRAELGNSSKHIVRVTLWDLCSACSKPKFRKTNILLTAHTSRII